MRPRVQGRQAKPCAAWLLVTVVAILVPTVIQASPARAELSGVLWRTPSPVALVGPSVVGPQGEVVYYDPSLGNGPVDVLTAFSSGGARSWSLPALSPYSEVDVFGEPVFDANGNVYFVMLGTTSDETGGTEVISVGDGAVRWRQPVSGVRSDSSNSITLGA